MASYERFDLNQTRPGCSWRACYGGNLAPALGAQVAIWRDLKDSPIAGIITVSGAIIVVLGILMIAMSFSYVGLLMAGLGVLLEALGYLAIRS